jgi:hypothetical protein
MATRSMCRYRRCVCVELAIVLMWTIGNRWLAMRPKGKKYLKLLDRWPKDTKKNHKKYYSYLS